MMIRDRWHELVGATSPSTTREREEALFSRLDAAYTESHRAYHTWRHIRECLDRLHEYAAASDLDDRGTSALEYALFYHDIVYRPTRTDNERRSARLAARELGGVLDRAQIDAISRLILATAHLVAEPAGARDDRLSPVIVDVDLAILGADRARFLEYESQIRAEYSWLEPARFAAGRGRILAAFTARDRIYRTEYFCARLEQSARENLSHVLARFYSV